MAEPQPLPESCEPIGPYRIVRALSRGGMGEVFLGRDDRLNRWVAIKRIRHDSDTPILRQRLLQEAHAAGGLRHPAIVVVYDLLQHAGDDCLVMEYVEGETLAEALRGGPLDPALAVRLAEGVASGLAAAHAAGIIHRDLKAENVMVTPAREAKVLDFGLAKPIGIPAADPALTAAGAVVGTCRAMSPEQARGDEVDERSDLFSLGVLLYEMLSGSSPFQGANSLATLTKVISERPPCLDTLRPGLPPRLVALVYRLLAKEPEARPQSAAEVARELHAVAAALAPGGDPAREETLTDLPTEAVRLWGGGDGGPGPPIATLPPAPDSPPARAPRPRRRTVQEMAALLSLVLLIQKPAAPIRSPSSSTAGAGRPPQSCAPASGVSAADRAAFLDIKRGFDAAESPPKPLPQLDRILQRSPGFLDARILAIDLAVSFFQSTRQQAYLDSAYALVERAKLAPENPCLLPSRFKIEMAAGRPQLARAELGLLQKSRPDDPHLPELRARFDESRGRTRQALAEWREAVKRNPSWQNLLRLAKLELTLGRVYVDDARRLLGEIQQRSPGNIYGAEALAELELFYGDPAKAEAIYRRLLARSPRDDPFTKAYWTNLGTARIFLLDYDGAAKAFREVLDVDPNDAATALNLADAELAQGHSASADRLYNQVFDQLKGERAEGGPSATDEMAQAQCLAHLGHTQKAMEIAERTVGKSRGDATILQSAALVFTLAGDRRAIVYIRNAIAKGIQPRWFTFPAYDRLRNDPDFQRLVEADPKNWGGPVGRPGSAASR